MAEQQHLFPFVSTIVLVYLLILYCVPSYHCSTTSSVITKKTREMSMQVDANQEHGLIVVKSGRRIVVKSGRRIGVKSGRRSRRDTHSSSPRHRPPHITEHPDDVSARKAEPTTFNCKADGNPTPTIEWYKDGKKIKHTGNRSVLPSGSLFFLNVMQRDTGTYHCVATNRLGSVASKEAILSLPSPTKSPSAHSHVPQSPQSPVRVPTNQYGSGSPFSGVDRRYPSFMSEVVTNQSYQPPPHLVHEGHNHNHPFLVEKDSRSGHFQDPLKQSWLIIIIALTVMFILSSAVLIFLMRQRSAKKRPIQQHIITTTIPKNNSLENTCSLIHEAVWMQHDSHHQTSSSSSMNKKEKKNQLKSSSNGMSPLVPSTNSKLIKTWSPPHHLLQQHINSSSKSSTTPSHTNYHHAGSIMNYEMHPTYEEAGCDGGDYAEVNDGNGHNGFSTFGGRRNNNGSGGNNGNGGNNGCDNARGQPPPICHSPGPYATTNLINITSNPYQQHYYNPAGSRAGIQHYMKSNISCPSPSPSQQSKQQQAMS